MTILKLNYHLHIWMLNPLVRTTVLLLFCVVFQNNLVECSNESAEDMIAALSEKIEILTKENSELKTELAETKQEREFWENQSQRVIVEMEMQAHNYKESLTEKNAVIIQIQRRLDFFERKELLDNALELARAQARR